MVHFLFSIVSFHLNFKVLTYYPMFCQNILSSTQSSYTLILISPISYFLLVYTSFGHYNLIKPRLLSHINRVENEVKGEIKLAPNDLKLLVIS
jgi:hypothetical protein